MSFVDVLRALRRQIILVIAITLIGLSVGVIVALVTPARYDARSDVYLTVQVPPDAGARDRAQATRYIAQVIDSYRLVINSALVLEPVIDELGLEMTTDELSQMVRTSASQESAVVSIRVSSPSPGQAARIANSIADSFSVAITETLESRDIETSYSVNVLQVQQAQVPLEPAAPNFTLSVVIGGVLGLLLGGLSAVARTVLDTRVRTVDDLERTVDKPVLGKFFHSDTAAKEPLVVATAPRTPQAEAFRTLRTNASFLYPDSDTGIFVVTSSGPGEGKSTTAANLAISFAEAGSRVVLIDADLRLPRVAANFGIEGAVGLTDVLVGRVSANEVLQRWGQGTLFLLPSGTPPPNPAELLGSPAMETLLNDLSAAFDIIIIDAPPVLLVTDAAVVSRFATGAMMVAASGTTPAPRLRDAVKSIESVGAHVLGTVMTMLPTRGVDRDVYGAYGSYVYGGSEQRR